MGELRSIGLVIATRTGTCNRRNIYKLNLFKKDSTVRAGVPVNLGMNSQGEDINTDAIKSGRQTCTSPSQVSNSPADRPVTSDSQTCPSFKISIKRIIEEEVHTHPDSKKLDQYVQWSIVLDNIDLPDQSIATWFCQFKPIDLVDGVLVISTSSEMAYNWCLKHYSAELAAVNVLLRLNCKVPDYFTLQPSNDEVPHVDDL